LRIAILSTFHPYRGGVAQFNGSLFAELGKIADVKAFNYSRQYPGILFPGKTQYVTSGDDCFGAHADRVLDTANPLNWPGAARKIRSWQPDLFILRYLMPWFAPSLGAVARGMAPGCKVVAIADNIIPHERHFFDKPFTKWFLGGLDGCVTLSSTVEKDLRSWAPEMPSRTLFHPLYNHFGEKLPREETERRLGLEPGKKNLLFFGLIRDYKGLDILLNAMAFLDDSYQLIVAGECYGSFEKYQQITESSPARDRIRLFNGFIEDERVKDFFSVADLTVLPYRSATQSGVCSASYHFEVPLVVTDVGGLREAIGDSGTGLVASAPEPREVATAIKEFFKAPSVRTACIRAIRREAERLGWTRFCEELLIFANSL